MRLSGEQVAGVEVVSMGGGQRVFGALWIPDFPVMAGLRAHPGKDLDRCVPCAVLAVDESRVAGKARDKLPILALNREGWLAGLAPGWSLGQALVRCPGLRIVSRDKESEKELREALFQLAESISADVEMTAEDAVVMDLAMVRERVCLDRLHLDGAEVCWAKAPTPDLAHLAARCDETQGCMVSADDMAGLPVSVLAALGGNARTLELLDTWGLGCLGDFMQLPRQGVVERLGPQAGYWHDVLHGKTCRLLKLHRVPESLAQEMDFEDPVEGVEQLVFALKRMLHVLEGRLAARHLAAACLELRLMMERGGEMFRCLNFAEPQAAVEGMLGPLQALLEALRLESAVVRMELDVETTFATAAQREWFGKHLPEPERWVETLGKLEAMLGAGRVGVPLRENSFRADAFGLRQAWLSEGGASSYGNSGEMVVSENAALPLRRFRPPREVAVAHQSEAGLPQPLAILSGEYKGRILRRRGPFLASGEWWDAALAWQRLEWDVELASGVGRLAFVKPETWSMEGWYE